MTHEIIKTESGKFALYVDDRHIADYTRKSDAKRGYARYLARTVTDDVQPSIFEQPTAQKRQDETPLNFVSRAVGEAFYLISQADCLLSAHKPQKGAGQPYTPAQRGLPRGAAARSPPPV